MQSKVGIEFNLRTCRRTFGQMLTEAGVAIESVSVAMGHATTKTTETYYARKRQDKALQEIFTSFEVPAPGAETP